jgi:cytidylate kinase
MTRDIHQIVDAQVARWRMERQVQETASRIDEKPSDGPPSHVVTIANPIGADARAIGSRVGELLGLATFDREIVEHIAKHVHVAVSTVETLDEHERGRFEEYVTSLLRERAFDVTDYLRELSRTVVALWKHGPCVLIGHGCIHVVPRASSLRVRVTAPVDVRVERVAKSGHFSPEEARRRVLQSDAEREAFHKRYFGVDVYDALLYDIVVNSDQLEQETCAVLIAEAYRAKFKLARLRAAESVNERETAAKRMSM